MKFPYTVKYNGVWYKPNEDVPMDNETPVKAKAEPKEPVKEVVKVEEPEVEETPVEEPKAEPTYTKTEINRMSIVDLRRLARKQGIKKAADKTGAELKAELIKLLNLQETCNVVQYA